MVDCSAPKTPNTTIALLSNRMYRVCNQRNAPIEGTGRIFAPSRCLSGSKVFPIFFQIAHGIWPSEAAPGWVVAIGLTKKGQDRAANRALYAVFGVFFGLLERRRRGEERTARFRGVRSARISGHPKRRRRARAAIRPVGSARIGRPRVTVCFSAARAETRAGRGTTGGGADSLEDGSSIRGWGWGAAGSPARGPRRCR